MRICSLLPGATEVVAALGLADQLVGISHECDYPPDVRQRPVMVKAVIDQERLSSPEIDTEVKAAVQRGQHLYELNREAFALAKPDLVITQDLCHVCAVTPNQLQEAISSVPSNPHVLTLNPTRMDDILSDIEHIGRATQHEAEARTFVSTLRVRLASIHHRVSSVKTHPSVLCLEWVDPFYVAGHWVPEMVEWAGGQNRLGRSGIPSYQVTWDQIETAAPDVLVLMPCGFSLERSVREADRLVTRPGWEGLPAVKQGNVFAVDASSYFSRPGPRLVDGAAILAASFHPDLFGPTLPPGVQRLTAHRPAPGIAGIG